MKLFSAVIRNETSRTLPGALIALLCRAVRPGYALDAYVLAPDLISTRGERTGKGDIEVEVFADGSGLEVAYQGKLFTLGVPKAAGAGWGFVRDCTMSGTQEAAA